MFNKLVAIEPVSLISSAEEALHRYAPEVVLFTDVPKDDAEIIRRISNADAVLLSYTSRIGRAVIDACPNIRYIGMCCSLYSEESANVDIAYAREKGIRVLGIRDYGDRGVVEYVLHELTGLLHGFGLPMLRDEPIEITGLRVGIVGLGVSGRMIADALAFMGAEISYYSRTRKPEAEQAGMTYKPLDALLAESEVVFTCLNKNVLLLGAHEFEQLGAGKVLFNTSIGPGFDSKALENWLNLPGTHFFCDTFAAEIRPQAVTDDRNIPLVNDIHQLTHLFGGHEVAFIDDHAVHVGQIDPAQFFDISALRHQPAAGAHNGRTVAILDLRFEHEHVLSALPIIILNHNRVSRLARPHRAISEIELRPLSVPPVCSHPLHYTLRLRFWQEPFNFPLKKWTDSKLCPLRCA